MEPEKQKDEATVTVPGKGGEQKDGKDPQLPAGANPELTDGKKLVELTQEDRELKERLELAVDRISDPQEGVVRAALELLRKELREATSSMTSVPKPLKFLGPQYSRLKGLFGAMPAGENKLVLADLLSVLGMTFGVVPGESLRFKLLGHASDIATWGSEYARSLAGEIGGEWARRAEERDLGREPPTAEEEAALATAAAAAAAAPAAGAKPSSSPKAPVPGAPLKGAALAKELASTLTLLGPPAGFTALRAMIGEIVPYHMAHNAEVEAVDLLLETESLGMLTAPPGEGGLAVPVDAASYPRVCLYLVKCSDMLQSGAPEEATGCLDVALALYSQHKQFPDALRVALKRGGLSQEEALRAIFSAAGSVEGDEARGTLRQMAYILARHRVNFVAGDDDLDAIIGNAHVPELYASLARDLDTVDPKGPEDIYKSHLAGDKRETSETVDSAKANLAASYVSGLVNAGYGTDKLLTAPAEAGSSTGGWVWKNKDTGMLSAAASLGLVHLWNEGSLSELDAFLHADDEQVRAGALLGMGVMCAGTRNVDIDPAFALLSEHLGEGNAATPTMRGCASLGLGIAYAGARREDLAALLEPYVSDSSPTATMEGAAMAGLALGMVWAGSAHEGYAAVLADRLMEANEAEAGQAIARHLALGLGLLFLGARDACEPIGVVLDTISHPLGETARVLLKSCAYAGSGDVLRVQELLRVCAEHPEAKDKEAAAKAAESAAPAAPAAPAAAAAGGASPGKGASSASGSSPADPHSEASGKYLHQSVAVLGLALVSLGEELSVDMATRSADHLLQYGDTSVRRAVPLALGLLHLSQPDYGVTDILSKLSHDPHAETASSAIFGLGMIGAGTNNSRIAGLLRTLALFYRNDPPQLFVVRLAQGLLHAGKGLVTLSPFHSDRTLLSHVGLAGILPAVLLLLDPAAGLHGKHHWLLFTLAAALNPRMMTTVDATGTPVTTSVRVGTAVETVGAAGRPKSITGFQTHTTPVLMGVKDRCELGDDAYVPLTTVLEGVVVVKPNPEAGKPVPGAKRPKAAAAGKGASSSSS